MSLIPMTVSYNSLMFHVYVSNPAATAGATFSVFQGMEDPMSQGWYILAKCPKK